MTFEETCNWVTLNPPDHCLLEASPRVCRSPPSLHLHSMQGLRNCLYFLTPCPVISYILWSGLAMWFASANGTSVVCVIEALIVITKFRLASSAPVLFAIRSLTWTAYVLSTLIPESEDACSRPKPRLQPETPVIYLFFFFNKFLGHA